MAVTSGGTDVAILDNAAHARPVVDRLCLALVILVAVVTAVFVYVAFWRDADRLWAGLDHDRNYHYGVALALADDVRHFNMPSLFDDLRHIRTWPPLHALLVGAVVTFAGPDFRVAVLPNLVAWTTTCVVIFLLTRATVRTFDRSSVFAANLAGFVAAGFALGSPGHRAFATDLMLESLGACLSMTCLYLYVRFRCFDGGVRALAVALVLLFFLKYNYWLLVAGALSGHTLWLLRQRALAVVAAGLTALRNGGWWLTQAKNPLTWLVSALLLLSAVVVICGGLSVAFAGREIVFSARSDNLLHVTLIVAVLRVAMAWPTEGRQIWQRLAPTTRKMALWHGLPVLLWFLLPKRLGYFIWFLSPRNGVNSDGNVVAAAQYYASEFAGTYHAVPLAAAVVLVAATLGCCTLFRRRAALAIVVFVLFSCLLTMNHPNRKSRFLHSWVPAVWVLAGVGTAALMTGPEPSPRRAWKTA
ncbi:MAG: hypothetical protein KDA63_00135, partial [Planctomycetales bacterium]|nr:hypothetical protein [Planctomycetales bacterium]